MGYKNWPEGKKIPKYMMVYEGEWVITRDIEDFMPPKEILNSKHFGGMVYYVDGLSYDLFNHEYVDGN